eukprot:4284201-Karenia_brevis.AAC.1
MMYDNMQGVETTDVGDPIDEEKVDLALHIFKTATAVGSDLWSPGDLRRLPKKAFRALAEILQQVERHATWPSFLLCHIIVLIGKPRGVQDL